MTTPRDPIEADFQRFLHPRDPIEAPAGLTPYEARTLDQHKEDGNGGCILCRVWDGHTFDDDGESELTSIVAWPCPLLRLAAARAEGRQEAVRLREALERLADAATALENRAIRSGGEFHAWVEERMLTEARDEARRILDDVARPDHQPGHPHRHGHVGALWCPTCAGRSSDPEPAPDFSDATPGPWVVQVPGDNDPGAGTVFIDTHAYADGPEPVVAATYPLSEADARLIVYAVNRLRGVVPALQATGEPPTAPHIHEGAGATGEGEPPDCQSDCHWAIR